MSLEHDIALRRGLDKWIAYWRKWTKAHPTVPDAQVDQKWREQEYLKMAALLDARKSLKE